MGPALFLPAVAFGQTATYKQPHRPPFRFTPAINWTSDPNGLVHHDGEWHLFCQHNPFGDHWGHMSWGHAESRDLFRWRRLAVAIPEAGEVMAFSGSAIVDSRNTCGLGRADRPAMVAIYTSRTAEERTQSIAFSLDGGRT